MNRMFKRPNNPTVYLLLYCSKTKFVMTFKIERDCTVFCLVCVLFSVCKRETDEMSHARVELQGLDCTEFLTRLVK